MMFKFSTVTLGRLLPALVPTSTTCDMLMNEDVDGRVGTNIDTLGRLLPALVSTSTTRANERMV